MDLTPLKLADDDAYWYLASPYSRYPDGEEAAFERVSAIADFLVEQRVPVYCPISHSHPLALYGGTNLADHDKWLWLDRRFMFGAHGLIITKMRSWSKSKGLAWELKQFTAWERPVKWLIPRELDRRFAGW